MKIISQFKYYNCVYPSSSDDPPTLEKKAECINCSAPIFVGNDFIEDEEGRCACDRECLWDYYIKNKIVKLKTME